MNLGCPWAVWTCVWGSDGGRSSSNMLGVSVGVFLGSLVLLGSFPQSHHSWIAKHSVGPRYVETRSESLAAPLPVLAKSSANSARRAATQNSKP